MERRTVVEAKLDRVSAYTLHSFSRFVDPKYDLVIVRADRVLLAPANLGVTIMLRHREPVPAWWIIEGAPRYISRRYLDGYRNEIVGYQEMDAMPSLEGIITPGEHSASVPTMNVGYFVPTVAVHGIDGVNKVAHATYALGRKGIGQFLMVMYIYICAWMNTAYIELEDAANIPGFYTRMGFLSVDEEARKLYLYQVNVLGAGYFTHFLHKILSKPGNEEWSWQNRDQYNMVVPPNPGVLLGGKRRKSRRKRRRNRRTKRRRT